MKLEDYLTDYEMYIFACLSNKIKGKTIAKMINRHPTSVSLWKKKIKEKLKQSFFIERNKEYIDGLLIKFPKQRRKIFYDLFKYRNKRYVSIINGTHPEAIWTFMKSFKEAVRKEDTDQAQQLLEITTKLSWTRK